MKPTDQEIDQFVSDLCCRFSSCYVKCDICKREFLACEGENQKNGKCPDDCDGFGDDYTHYIEYGDQTICEWCELDYFRKYVEWISANYSAIMNHYSRQIKDEKASILSKERLFTGAKR